MKGVWSVNSADNRLFIVDTTLRDGEQRAGLAFSKEEKIACAVLMDEAGIDQIEAGIPAMCRQEKETIRAIIEHCGHAKIAAWNRMNESDIRVSLAIMPDIIHIGVPVSDIQIGEKLHKTREFVLESMKRCVGLAQSRGSEVTLGFEDASRADISFMRGLITAARQMGVLRIRYADTVGIVHPLKVARDISLLRASGVAVECHMHNDLGMAVANSMEAAKSGSAFINTTFFGIGERAGNCDFRKFVFAAKDKFTFGFRAGEAEAQALERRILATLNFNPAKRA
jgi:homocitrate synthase NifV